MTELSAQGADNTTGAAGGLGARVVRLLPSRGKVQHHRLRITREMLLRVVADVLLVNVAVVMALGLRFVHVVTYTDEGVQNGIRDTRGMFDEFVSAYLASAWLLTLICIAVFAWTGFYTHGRYYVGRYKAVVVIQSVTIAYLLFAFLSHVVGLLTEFPRGALVLAWLLTSAAMVVARMWSLVWRTVYRYEVKHAERHSPKRVRRVLVIGGAGYIGSALLKELLAKGYHVRVLDLLLYGDDAIKEFLDHPRLEVVQADFRHVDQVVGAMRGMDACVHLGGIVGDPACALDEAVTIEVNLMATRMIAEVAKGCGVSRFVFASTCSVYGASDELLDERSVLRPVSLYARSKIASEQVLEQMTSHDFAPTTLRFGTIYGLSGRTRFDLVANLLTAKAVVEGRITVMGSDQWRPFVHVDDAAAAIVKVLERPMVVVRNQIFNVGSDDQNNTIGDVAAMIKARVPDAEIVDLGSDGDRRNYRVDFTKIRTLLGFEPRWHLGMGIEQVIGALESGRVQDYLDPRHSNVKFMSDDGGYQLSRQSGWAYELIYGPSEPSVVTELPTGRRPRPVRSAAASGQR